MGEMGGRGREDRAAPCLAQLPLVLQISLEEPLSRSRGLPRTGQQSGSTRRKGIHHRNHGNRDITKGKRDCGEKATDCGMRKKTRVFAKRAFKGISDGPSCRTESVAHHPAPPCGHCVTSRQTLHLIRLVVPVTTPLRKSLDWCPQATLNFSGGSQGTDFFTSTAPLAALEHLVVEHRRLRWSKWGTRACLCCC